MLVFEYKASNKALQLSLIILMAAALASYWAVSTVTKSKETSALALLICLTAVTLGLLGVKIAIRKPEPDMTLKANEYSTRFSKANGSCYAETAWQDPDGGYKVLTTSKKGDYIITSLNGKQIFIHGTEASVNDIRKHHTMLRLQIFKQIV